jgi:hypothetical protein
MENTLTLEQVDRELEILHREYQNWLDTLQREVTDEMAKFGPGMAGERPIMRPISHHFGHNAGTRASELQMIAGKIEQMQRVRAAFTQ